MHDSLARERSKVFLVFPLIIITTSLFPLSAGAQARSYSISLNSDESLQEVEVLHLIPRIAIGVISGNVHGNDVIQFARPGAILTGSIKFLVTPEEYKGNLGAGILAGVSTTLRQRAVEKWRVWGQYGYQILPLEGKHLRQQILFIGPFIQFGIRRTRLRCQLGVIWNKANWDSNLFDDIGDDWTFEDDKTGAGTFLNLEYGRYSLSIFYQECEGRLVSHFDQPRNYSIPILSKNTWVTLGFSFHK